EAVEANKPRHFVLGPEMMVELALAAAQSRDVQEILPRHLWPRRRERLLKAIAAGLAAENPPKILRHKSSRQTEAEKRRMTELEKRRNLRATELDLDPTLIASRAMLVMLARDWSAHEKALMSWQKQLLSER